MSCGEFESFLSSSLQRLQLDEDVFSGYVTGILETSGDECTYEEFLQSLLEVLEDAVESDITPAALEDVCGSIVKRWQTKMKADAAEEEEQKQKAKAALQAKIASQPACAASKSVSESSAEAMTEEERSKRQAFLAQYNYELADDDDNNSDDDGASARLDRALGVFENSNRRAVAEAHQAKRAEIHAKHVARTEQTKQAREKQLQQQQERKEKAKQKVQKRERRR